MVEKETVQLWGCPTLKKRKEKKKISLRKKGERINVPICRQYPFKYWLPIFELPCLNSDVCMNNSDA